MERAPLFPRSSRLRGQLPLVAPNHLAQRLRHLINGQRRARECGALALFQCIFPQEFGAPRLVSAPQS